MISSRAFVSSSSCDQLHFCTRIIELQLPIFCFGVLLLSGSPSDNPIRTTLDNILSILKYCFMLQNRQVTGFIFQVICTIDQNSAYYFLRDTFNLMKEWKLFSCSASTYYKKNQNTPLEFSLTAN